jgi:hypothetical protein
MKKTLTTIAILLALVSTPWAAPAESYRASVGSGSDEIPLVVVSGTPYEMGKALGTLMKSEIETCMTRYLAIVQQADPIRASKEALDAAWKSVSPHVDDRFKEELRGLAEGCGVPLAELIRGHMVPVVSDYACSGVAVWGSNTKDGHLYQIRNLDFSMDVGLQDCPALVVYLPEKGFPHILPTFAGCIGANTGMNTQGIALGEKGGSPESEYPFDLNGNHFMMLFRDILYDADSLERAKYMITASKLIKRYHLYVGDGTAPDQGAVKIRVSMPDPVKVNVWGDNDSSDEVAPSVSQDAIYFTMDNEKCFKDLSANKGKYDAEKMIALSRSLSTDDGSLLTVVYDATSLELWVAYAEKQDPAKKRPFIHVNLKDYLDPAKAPEGAVRLSGF